MQLAKKAACMANYGTNNLYDGVWVICTLWVAKWKPSGTFKPPSEIPYTLKSHDTTTICTKLPTVYAVLIYTLLIHSKELQPCTI